VSVATNAVGHAASRLRPLVSQSLAYSATLAKRLAPVSDSLKYIDTMLSDVKKQIKKLRDSRNKIWVEGK
jgi:hypothetical protein